MSALGAAAAAKQAAAGGQRAAGAVHAAPDAARLEAAFDAGFADGARALLWALPAGAPRAVLLCLQPFAEEANLSRRMIVAQARRLAARGYAVLVPDLYGTGDSAGDFEAATLARWRDDVARAAAIAVARTQAPLVLWGVRFGALLAADCAPHLPARALLAWHAQRDGGEPVAQFQRLARLRALMRRAPAGVAATAAPAAASAASGSGSAGRQDRLASAADGAEPPEAALLAAGPPPAQPLAGSLDQARPLAAGPVVAPVQAAAPVESGGYRIAPVLIEAMQALRWPSELPCALCCIEQASVPFWHALDAPPDTALFEATEQALESLVSVGPALAGARSGAATPGSGALAAVEPTSAADVPPAEAAPGDLRSEDAARDSAAASRATTATAAPSQVAAAAGEAPVQVATERMVSFQSAGRVLRGVLHPASGAVGVIVVPGQPQTRVGSHRMFVQLARALAAAGYPVLRYDLAGYGDSDGEPHAYDAYPGDVAAAAAALRGVAPGVTRVVAWGLCDGATAAALASAQLPQLAGLVLVNPWVHDESLRAQAIVGGHYRDRLASGTFWRRLLVGQVQVGSALREAAGHLRRARAARGSVAHGSPAERLLQALRRTTARTCLVLSGKDLTAGEMQALLTGDKRWRELGVRLHVERLPEADHTLSESAHLQRMIEASVAFVARA